jgi:head-tail adaptor
MDNRIGAMTVRILLEAPAKTPDGMGGTVSVFSVVPGGSNIPAQAWTTSSTEAATGEYISVVRVQKFKIWFRTVLKGNWRVKWGTRIFSITAIDPDDRNRFIYLTCKEVA